MSDLTCSSCSLYLSVYPIYINVKGEGAVCGRCKLPNPTHYLRDKQYEDATGILQFPCRNADIGCETMLAPPALKRHEYRCPFREINCPAQSLLNCNWMGAPLELEKHYKSVHPMGILLNGIHELDFTMNFPEVYLMPFKSELFVVRSQVNTINNVYHCSVEHFPTFNSAPYYKYVVSVENENVKSISRSYPARHTDSTLQEVTCISRAELDEDLPGVQKLKILFTLHVDLNMPNDRHFDYTNDVTEDMKDLILDWAKLDGVKCQSCYGYLVNPIQECPNKHVMCMKCSAQSKCNMCQMELQPIKNAALVGLIGTLTYPCANRAKGCMVLLKSIYIREHETRCRYACYECPLKEEMKCEVTCELYEIDTHINFHHFNAMLIKESVEIVLQENPLLFKKYFMIIHDGKVFKLIFKQERETLMWSTVIVGSYLDAKKYNFQIEIIDKHGRDIGILSRAACTPISEKNTCFILQDKCVFFVYEQVDLFMKDMKLSFRVKIILAEHYYEGIV